MSNPDANEMKRSVALARALWPSNGAFSDACRKVEKMSTEKTLGQVAHAAFTEGYELADHYLVDAARWERVAQAIELVVIERMAAMFADMPRDDLSPMGVAETIRKTVKP